MGSRGQSSRKGFTSAQKAKVDNLKRLSKKRGYTDVKFHRNEAGEVEYTYTEKKTVQQVHGGFQAEEKNDVYERTIVHSGRIGKDGLITRNKDEKTDVLVRKGREPKLQRKEDNLTLDKDLVRRANEASTIFDAGDATQRQYDRDIKEIRSMDLTATEKAQAIRDLHRMTEEQLKAEGQARSPYATGMGPARFNRRQVSQRADKAAEARQATQNFMNNLRKAQQAKAKQQQAADMKTALSNALANKQLSFEFGGKTWTRKSLRSKTFTAR